MRKKVYISLIVIVCIATIIVGTIIIRNNSSKHNKQTTDNISNSNTQNDDVNSTNSIKPWDYVKLLGHGIDVDWSKTSQGQKYYNEKTVIDFKSAGVSHVRIRIEENISDELLKGLDKQLKDCINNKLIPIIAYQADDFKKNPSDESVDKVVKWWSAIANRYKNYSNILAFDLVIEPSDMLNKEQDRLYVLYEKVTSEIRKSNPNRIIMVAPNVRSSAENLKSLKLPSQGNGYLIVEWHFYAAGPSKTNNLKLWTNGNESEQKLIKDKIDMALTWQKENNIPTWVGAWMPGNYNDGDDYTVYEQVIFSKFMVKSLNDANIPFAVNSDTKFYNRENNTWINEMKPVFDTIFNNE